MFHIWFNTSFIEEDGDGKLIIDKSMIDKAWKVEKFQLLILKLQNRIERIRNMVKILE